MVCKIGFTNWNSKITLFRAFKVVTYYNKFFRTWADRHNGILMSLLLLAAEAINHASMNDYNYGKLRLSLKVVSLQIC